MKKAILALPFLTLFACQTSPSNNNLLLGEWQAIELQNPQIDALLEQQRMILDTMTQLPAEAAASGMPPEISTVDSFKAHAYRELDALRDYYRQSATETKFTFRKDSVAILDFPQGADSARYTMEGDSLLVLNERALKSVGDERLVMYIDRLSADSLTLSVPEANTRSVMRFRKIK